MPVRKTLPAANSVSDEALMERYVHGDGPAFDEIFQRYERRAFAYFSRRTGSPDRAQDLYQELFLRVHRARDAYDAQRAFAPWFFQIAHRLLIDDRRRTHRAYEVPLEDSAAVSTRDETPARVADRQQLTRALAGLSEEERFVLVRAKGGGESYAEIALHLGKSVAAVKKMASRAMRRLQRDATVYSPSSAAHCH